MKYPCNVIRDLLPLFYDGVCSEESAEIVRAHLAECAECRKVFEEISSREDMELPAAIDGNVELKKAASLQKLRRMLNLRRMVSVLMALLLVVGVCLWNDHGEMFMPHQDSMRVYFDESGNLVLHGMLPCSAISINSVLIPMESEGQQQNHVFVRYFCRPLDYALSKLFGREIDSMYVVGFAEKGADAIDAVHYVTDDFENHWFRGDIPVDELELQQYIDASVTLWTKE